MSLKKSKAGKEDKNQNKKNERIGEDSSDDEMYLGEKIAIVRQKAEYSAAEEAMGKPTERIAPAGENKKDSISPGEFSYVAYGGIAILGVILFAVTIAFFLKKNKRKSLNNDYLY
ncbi:hypothetical protein MHBO_001756 [Bonamia ostreae]|uniref:Uncharacterized protein n=1 Tax=Bonamia ostreae TaxID=126728 RepID=A0ABV2AK22_9EUKA